MWAVRIIQVALFVAIIAAVGVVVLLSAGATRQITEPGRCSDVCEYTTTQSSANAPGSDEKLWGHSW